MHSREGGLAADEPLFYKPEATAYDEKCTPAEFSTCAYRVFHSRLAAAYCTFGVLQQPSLVLHRPLESQAVSLLVSLVGDQ
jgi:hypothetical protein